MKIVVTTLLMGEGRQVRMPKTCDPRCTLPGGHRGTCLGENPLRLMSSEYWVELYNCLNPDLQAKCDETDGPHEMDAITTADWQAVRTQVKARRDELDQQGDESDWVRDLDVVLGVLDDVLAGVE